VYRNRRGNHTVAGVLAAGLMLGTAARAERKADASVKCVQTHRNWYSSAIVRENRGPTCLLASSMDALLRNSRVVGTT